MGLFSHFLRGERSVSYHYYYIILLGALLVLGPVSDVSAQADHVVLEEVQLAEAGLLVGLVEVSLEGGQPLVLVLHQHPDRT